MTDDQIKHMTNRFLSWKLPENFNPDNGISAERPNYGAGVAWEPMGTNLLDYTQAEAMIRHLVEGIDLATPHQSGRTGDREGVENVGCNYCGAQVALMGADYLEQLADALDKVGAPRKSPDGNEHYGLEKRIAALGEGRTGAGEALLKRARVQIELGRATGNHTGNPLNIYQIAEELLAALSQSTAGEDGA